MIRRFSLAVAATLFATDLPGTPARGHCVEDIRRINAAMPQLDEKRKTIAKKVVAEAALLHKAGRHPHAIKLLHETMTSLGIKH